MLKNDKNIFGTYKVSGSHIIFYFEDGPIEQYTIGSGDDIQTIIDENGSKWVSE